MAVVLRRLGSGLASQHILDKVTADRCHGRGNKFNRGDSI
jgi:hypothetical protein